MIFLARYESPLGRITLRQEGQWITGLWFEGQKHGDVPKMGEYREEDTPLLSQAKEWLDHYFLGEAPSMDLPLKAAGTPFQETVWKILQKIPYGSTVSYEELGQQVCRAMKKERMSSQAVGQAVGRNPIAVLIPCHRVLGKDGSLTGYDGGIERKEALLKMEGSI